MATRTEKVNRKVDDSSFLDEDYSKSKDTPSKLSPDNKRNLFINLLQSGFNPAEALVGAHLDPLQDSMAEVNLEMLLLSRIKNPRGKIYTPQQLSLIAEDFDDIRKEGELTLDELRGLVDWMHYTKTFPLVNISKILSVPVSIIADIKKDISDENYLAIKRLTPENYIGDFIHQQEKLKALAFSDLLAAPLGSKERIMLLKFLQSADEAVIAKLQDIGIIEKHLGNLQVHEEWTIKVSQNGPPVTQHREYKDDDAFRRTELEDVIDAEILSKSNSARDRSLPELAYLDSNSDFTSKKNYGSEGPDHASDTGTSGADNPKKNNSEIGAFKADNPYSQHQDGLIAPTPSINKPAHKELMPKPPPEKTANKLSAEEIINKVNILLAKESINPAITKVYIEIPKPNPDEIPPQEFIKNPGPPIENKFLDPATTPIKITRN